MMMMIIIMNMIVDALTWESAVLGRQTETETETETERRLGRNCCERVVLASLFWPPRQSFPGRMAKLCRTE